jgi:squalene-associated FAD-dependent desaturase
VDSRNHLDAVVIQSVAIIGAGYAGLACAVDLATEGVQVTVFDRSHVLGGRARLLTKDGRRVDNGQHILIGAYTELTRMLRHTRVSPKVLERLPLTLESPGRFHLRAAELPAPLHLAVGLLRARGLTWADRFAVMRLIRMLKRKRFQVSPEQTVQALLHETAQTPHATTWIWEPLCVAALNTPVAYASAQVFANVLRDSVAAHATASELLIPRVDLSELFPVQAARYLATRRGKLRTGTTVKAIERVDGGFRLDCDHPTRQVFEQVVIATAPYHAPALLRAVGGCERLAQQIEALDYEPITTVYYALGESVSLSAPMLLLADGPAQWVFDRGQLGGEAGLLACVISAHGEYEKLSREDLEIAIHQQLERELGRRLPSPDWVLSVVEKRATIACRPGIVRPDIKTPVPGLWLAGDYVDSPYPATLESAVRSGTASAQAVLRHVPRV